MAKKTHTLLEEILLFSKELNCNHPFPEPNLYKRPPTFSNQNEEREYALTKAKSLLQHYSSNIHNPSKIHISESGPGIPINYTYSSGKKIILAYIVC